MATFSQITVPVEKARHLRDFAQYPTPLLQWFSNVMYGYWNTDWKGLGEAERVDDASRRLETVLDAFRGQAMPDVPDALLALYRTVWPTERGTTETDELPFPGGRPKGWNTWGPAEREAWTAEQLAWKEFDRVCATAATTNGKFSLGVHDEIQASAAELYGAMRDRARANLKRWRPDLADLIELAFLEESDRDSNLNLSA